MVRLLSVAAGLSALVIFSSAAAALTVTTDPKGAPESIAAAPDGGLILGSSSKPVIYRAGKGEIQAKVFIDASAEGNVTFLGVLADASTNTLWACQIGASVPGNPNRQTVLRSFDLRSGVTKTRWALPGDSNLCNDFTIGPDHALYVSDTAGARIYQVKPGATEGALLLENKPLLTGIDGLTFLDGQLYVNNVLSNQIYRIPIDASGKAGAPVQIWTDQPIKGPDGMRASNGKLFLAENRNGRASMLTVTGDIAHVVPVMDGLAAPTAIDPAGDTLWVGDRPNDKAISIPMPK
jgi:sugar lactone lactonase YvrE